MTCLGPPEIARAVATGEVPEHVRDCVECRRALEQQRAVRDALRALPAPHATGARRRAIKTEAMAATAVVAKRSRAVVGAIALGVAIAAGAVAFALHRAPQTSAPIAVDLPATEAPVRPARTVAHEPAPAHRDAPAIAAVTAELPAPPSRGRVDSQVARDRDAASTVRPPEVPAALASFRDAWIALRAGDNRTAIALFDRATDPAVAEEATYWAAVAAKRAGDDADARRRFTDFIARFPRSPYLEAARRAIETQ